MTGLVSLVGSGPGDPGLLTLKAMRRLEEADLVIYDYLANPEHLRHARPDAVKIGVGKGFRYKTLSQEKINRLILASARKGQRVVRLKGGDPYLFGRGGEEALHLASHKIPFEVVPGVTSATACAAYAGIPLTHRDHNASVTFLTGHRAEDGHLDSVPWKKIAAIPGTIVIYMGFYNLARIVDQLVRAGMASSTPVAVIEWGTLPRQKSVAATLGTIAARVKLLRFGPPCIIIIGEVVSLKNKLGWFERQPLFGQKIAVMRASEQGGGLGAKLSALGAQVIELPLIEILPPRDISSVDAAIRRLGRYNWIVFSSHHGVEVFFRRLEALHLDARALTGVRVASVGAETSRSLLRYGIRPNLQPARFETRAVLQTMKRKTDNLAGKKILLVKPDIAPVDLEKGLEKMGAEVHRLTAYRTRMPKSLPTAAIKAMIAGEADYAAFTSSSTVENFVKAFGRAGARAIARKTRFLSIGPVTTRTLRAYGLKPYRQAKTFTLDGLVETLVKTGKI